MSLRESPPHAFAILTAGLLFSIVCGATSIPGTPVFRNYGSAVYASGLGVRAQPHDSVTVGIPDNFLPQERSLTVPFTSLSDRAVFSDGSSYGSSALQGSVADGLLRGIAFGEVANTGICGFCSHADSQIAVVWQDTLRTGSMQAPFEYTFQIHPNVTQIRAEGSGTVAQIYDTLVVTPLASPTDSYFLRYERVIDNTGDNSVNRCIYTNPALESTIGPCEFVIHAPGGTEFAVSETLSLTCAVQGDVFQGSCAASAVAGYTVGSVGSIEYGSAVPEPSAIALTGCGLLVLSTRPRWGTGCPKHDVQPRA